MLVIDYFKHGLTAAFGRLLFTAVVRVCAVAPLVVGFHFLAACFALKSWHRSSQKKIAEKHKNLALGAMY